MASDGISIEVMTMQDILKHAFCLHDALCQPTGHQQPCKSHSWTAQVKMDWRSVRGPKSKAWNYQTRHQFPAYAFLASVDISAFSLKAIFPLDEHSNLLIMLIVDELTRGIYLLQAPRASFKPAPLRLDDQGREIDEFGNVVKKAAESVTTLKVSCPLALAAWHGLWHKNICMQQEKMVNMNNLYV